VTVIDYAARVARGIALMDEKWPNWVAEIDLDRLDIASGVNCVTAQYAQKDGSRRSYLTGQSLLGLDDSAYEAHGFNAEGQSTGETEEYDPDGYATLNALWRAEILRRRAQADTAPAEDLLAGIHDAAEAGMSHRDIAYAVGFKSSSGIAAKVRKGAAVLAARKR
jgi:hypothetical protein